MKTYFDCIPCFLRQAIDVARHVSDDETMHEHVIREVLRYLNEMDLHKTPPEMGQKIHRLIRELTGDDDPYAEAKKQSNTLALDLLPKLRAQMEKSGDPLEMAVRFAIAGNILDFGALRNVSKEILLDTIDQSTELPIDGDVDTFRDAVDSATRILYLTDNAGEIVFDRLLIEQIGPEKITVAVKGSPTINDATMHDAETTGLTELVNVIDNGSDVPGTLLDECSDEFMEHFNKADMVIAKGQGNYETLSEVEKDIFFILKIKCPVIAEDIGCELWSMVLKRSSR